jgi:hypothetical protein
VTEIVVVAHGLWMQNWASVLLRRRFEAAGFATAAFTYPSVTAGLDENAERLAEFTLHLLDAAVAASAAAHAHAGVQPTAAASRLGPRVHFVGHSLGGVVAARMLGGDGLGRERLHGIGRLVCLGSPLVGCHGADVLLAHRWTRPLAGRCLADLVAAGGLGRWSGPCELGVLAGDGALGFGRLLGGLPRPHDGTVAVAETRLPGANDHRVMHVTHMSLLWSKKVVDETIRFLRTGRFSNTASG